MASRRIISSFVRLWALTTPGIREQQRGKIRDCRPYPLERGMYHRDRGHIIQEYGHIVLKVTNQRRSASEQDPQDLITGNMVRSASCRGLQRRQSPQSPYNHAVKPSSTALVQA